MRESHIGCGWLYPVGTDHKWKGGGRRQTGTNSPFWGCHIAADFFHGYLTLSSPAGLHERTWLSLLRASRIQKKTVNCHCSQVCFKSSSLSDNGCCCIRVSNMLITIELFRLQLGKWHRKWSYENQIHSIQYVLKRKVSITGSGHLWTKQRKAKNTQINKTNKKV